MQLKHLKIVHATRWIITEMEEIKCRATWFQKVLNSRKQPNTPVSDNLNKNMDYKCHLHRK